MSRETTAVHVGLALALIGCSDGSASFEHSKPTRDGSGNHATPSVGTPGASGGGGAISAGDGPVLQDGGGLGAMEAGGNQLNGGDSGPVQADGGEARGSDAGENIKHGPFKMLVLSTALVYRHDSIVTGLQMLKDLGKSSADTLAKIGAPSDANWTVDEIGSNPKAANYFSEINADNLKNYEVVYSDNPTGPVFSEAPNGAEKKQIFRDYWEKGGSWAGQHAATDFENNSRWPWFQDNVNGGWFVAHDDDPTPGAVTWEPQYADHPIWRGLLSPWNASDEWYIMNRNIEAVQGFKVLAKVTVSSSAKPGGTTPRPAIWITENAQGARSFYTIRGHHRGFTRNRSSANSCCAESSGRFTA